MPGKQVKNWPQYEALRKQGHSKESAARITNASQKERTMPKPPDRTPSSNPDQTLEERRARYQRAQGRRKTEDYDNPIDAGRKRRVAQSKDREGPEPQNLSPQALERRRDKFAMDRMEAPQNPKAAKIAAIRKLGAQVRAGRLAGAKRGQ